MTTENSPMIVPRHKAKGVDFCATIDNYIIRSDLGCYMSCKDFRNGSKLSIHPLHQSLRDGDHYLAYYHKPDIVGSEYPSFIIIKGNEFKQVYYDLEKDNDSENKKLLNPFCQNGDHYLGLSKFRLTSTDPVYFIIFKDKFRVVSDLETAIPSKWDKYDQKEYTLHENCKNGLYYWATKAYWSGNVAFCIVKQVDKWGFQYHVTEDLSTDKNGEDHTFGKEVIEFIPGGMSVTMGPTFGKWEIIERGKVAREIAETKTEISFKVGVTKGVETSIEANWNITTGFKEEVSAEVGKEGVAKAAVKSEFSWEASVGGKIIHNSEQNWSEETTVVKEINLGKLEPGSEYFIWQYVIGREKTGVIFRPLLWEVTSTNSPPSKSPL